MAKQKGIIRLHGTLGGINFYDRLGEPLARESGGGFNSQSAKKYPRIQEQITEMTAASITNKIFKRSFRSLMLDYKDGTLHYRLQSFFMRVKDLDLVSARGQRTVGKGMAHPYAQRLLLDFNFTPKRSLLINGQLEFDWASHELTVSRFDIADAGMPKTADAIGLVLLTVRFDFEALQYVTQKSTPLMLGRDFNSHTFSLQTAALSLGNGLRFAMLRVAYYQEVNGDYYILPGDGQFGLGVVAVE